MPERFHQLVPTLRHRSIEDLHEGARLDPVLHDVPLNPLLRRRVRDRPWPHSARLFLEEAEEPSWGVVVVVVVAAVAVAAVAVAVAGAGAGAAAAAAAAAVAVAVLFASSE